MSDPRWETEDTTEYRALNIARTNERTERCQGVEWDGGEYVTCGRVATHSHVLGQHLCDVHCKASRCHV